MKKIGMATVVYNAERWIYPFLKLTEGLDRRVLVLGKAPIEWVGKEHGVSLEPDRTEKLVRKYFPGVEIIEQQAVLKDFNASFWNQGHEYLSGDCDFILRFDSDEMMLPEHWDTLIGYLRINDSEALSIDFGKDAVLFYHDLDHGIPHESGSWIETRGLKNSHTYQNIGAFLGESFLFSPPGFVIYHYNGWKRGQKDKERIEKQKRKWVKTPKLIKDLFFEGAEKLKKI